MKTAMRLGEPRRSCAQCVCVSSPTLATACANTDECWQLVDCAAAYRCMRGDMFDVACISNNCRAFADDMRSTVAATPFSGPIVRAKCDRECVPPGPIPGGDDAGT